jgi:hypothetical protein
VKQLFQEGRKDQFFDADLAMELYETFLVTLDDGIMEELLLQIGTLVDMVCQFDIGPSIGECNHPALKADAIQLVYLKLIEGKISTARPRSFMNYLWKLIRHSMLHTIKDLLYQQRFEDWVDSVAGEVDDSVVDAEARIYAQQIAQHALHIFKADIRFSGKEHDACVFIAECLLGLRRLDPKTARFRFRISESRVNFLIRYATYLLKHSADVAKEIDEGVAANDS